MVGEGGNSQRNGAEMPCNVAGVAAAGAVYGAERF